jgi:HlyD family secretion protein
MNMSLSSSRRKQVMSIIGSLTLACALAPRSVWPQQPPAEARHPAPLRTAPITRGTLRVIVRGTGTLEPKQVVDVSAQVSGVVRCFGPDPRGDSVANFKNKTVDYNTPVEAGTVLAIIDDTAYVAAVESAKADVRIAQAELELAKATAELAASNWRRAEELVKTNAISTTEFDTANSNRRTAEANQKVAEAKLAKSEVAHRQAGLDLDHTRIVSPINGVVIDRRVNVGQAVAPNAGGPSLFLIAGDLGKLEIWASVNEADIGQIHAGQAAQFRVDTFPEKSFTGHVSEVRLNATSSQNVVLYTAVVSIDKGDTPLLPYLTAAVEFDVGHHEHVLLLPNAALGWRPLDFPPQSERPRSPDQLLWIKDGDSVKPVAVRAGPTDGQFTEIIKGDVKEGTEVVVGGQAISATEK